MQRVTNFKLAGGVLLVVSVAGCQIIAGLTGKEIALPADDGGAATCSDGVRNGSETDKDCGGGDCSPCDEGKRCVVGADCKDGVCASGACAAPTCEDEVKNGDETGVDCGGPTCPKKCSAGEGCEAGADCVSAICGEMICAPSCTDQVKDGDESDIDCGGSCPGCAIGLVCGKHADCESGVCDGGKCVDFVESLTRMGGTSGTDRAWLAGLQIDASGNVALGANFSGKANFGGATTYDAGGAFAYAFAFARYNPLGQNLWDHAYVGGSAGSQLLVDAFAVSPSGQFVAFGTFGSTSLDFGNGFNIQAPYPGARSAFYSRFSAANVAQWAQSYGGQNGVGDPAFNGIAVSASGNTSILIGSGKWGDFKVGSTSVSNGDMFVVQVPSGWGAKFNDGGSSDALVGVAIDGMANVIVAGHHEGTLNFGGGMVNGATDGQGFVLKLSSAGAYVWATSFMAAPDALAVDGSGNAIVCGEFSGSLDFGTGKLSSSGTSVFVAKLDPSGAAIWAKAFAVTGTMPNVKTLVASDVAGNILIGATVSSGTIDFGGGALGGGMIVAKLDPSGAHVWSNGFGVPPKDVVQGIAAYNDTEILVGGHFAGTLTMGSAQPVSSVGSEDIFLAKLRLPQ